MTDRPSQAGALIVLFALLAAAILVAAGAGAYRFSPARMAELLAQGLGWKARLEADTIDRNVFLTLRLPRVLLAGFTGATLGVCGTAMQGLFRNPIVEPGLIGTSAGAALGAALVFVLGVPLFAPGAGLGLVALPACAFLGALGATVLTFRIASGLGRVHVLTLLLAGIAVNALCAAGTGFLSYVARDPQARNITFWSLGTFTTASWRSLALVAAAWAIGYLAIARDAKALNALMLGEDEAASLGVDVPRLTRRLLVFNTLMVAVATATVGVITFVGLVVPHVLRLLRTSNHAFLIPASALLGAAFTVTADTAARLVIPPAELPIGILTAAVGAPVFLVLLLRLQRVGVAGSHG
jgi:iron complex transport system permease protein